MQLPPTILSLDKHEKKNKRVESSERQCKNGPESKQASTKHPKLGKGDAPLTTNKEGSVTDSSSEPGAGSESESIHGDAVVAEDTTVPLVDAQESLSQSVKQQPLKHPSLRPPRTLETTLFDRLERMYGRGVKRLLNVQYRYSLIDSDSHFTHFAVGCTLKFVSSHQRRFMRPN